ncbi:MAG: LytTR family DNA-binding domain-containing protein, partial [Panacibacter sp.]
SCPVIFTTAYDEYAIRAFKVNGVDYLLKPVDETDLKNAIDKCRKLINEKTKTPVDINQLLLNLSTAPSKQKLYKEKFIVSIKNNWIPINTNDIACFTRENLNYLFTFNNSKHILDYTTLEDIEDLLDPKIFYRANRQSIVHINAIQSVKLHENQKLTVTLKAPLKMEIDISREKAPAFKKWFDR